MKRALFLFVLIVLFQSCSENAVELNSDDDSTSTTTPTNTSTDISTISDALYAQHCQDCHGVLTSSSKKESTPEAITQAIASIGDMNFLSTLSQTDINTIASELSYSPPSLYSIEPTNNTQFEADKTSVAVSFNTNEIATCKYSLSDIEYSLMSSFNETAGSSHSVNIDVTGDTSYNVYVRCEDAYKNINLTSSIISFSVKDPNAIDETKPVITNYSPEYDYAFLTGTTEASISLTTNETSTCKYSANSADTYSSMAALSSTQATEHSQVILDLQDGQSYLYYFICADSSLNESLKFSLSFSVNLTSLTGLELYNRSCLNCHGDIENSNKKFRTSEQIQTAIASIANMKIEELEALSTAQIELISQALNVRDEIEVDDNALITNLILGDRRYLDYVILHKIFGKADSEDPTRTPWTERDGYWLFKNYGMGGACDVYTNAVQPDGSYPFPWEKCQSLYFGSIYANEPVSYTTTRAAYVIRACEANAHTIANREAATAEIGGVDALWSTENFTTIYQKFFLLETPAPIVVETFQALFNSQPTTDLGWKSVVVALCISPEWQIL